MISILILCCQTRKTFKIPIKFNKKDRGVVCVPIEVAGVEILCNTSIPTEYKKTHYNSRKTYLSDVWVTLNELKPRILRELK